jgi:metallo-beta-lactamase class B
MWKYSNSKAIIFIIILMSGQWGIAQSKPDSLIYSRLSATAWEYTAYTTIEGYYFPSNGLIIKTDTGLVLIDTPVNDSLTKVLIDKFSRETQLKFCLAVITHAHIDRIGGIRALRNAGIPIICYEKTARLAVIDGYPLPDLVFKSNDTVIHCGNKQLELFFPGWGHTEDNIVVWLPEQKILYGGCFIKAIDSESLGNTKDANKDEWLIAAIKVSEKFKQAEIVIPGHGNIGNRSLIKKTIQLLKN